MLASYKWGDIGIATVGLTNDTDNTIKVLRGKVEYLEILVIRYITVDKTGQLATPVQLRMNTPNDTQSPIAQASTDKLQGPGDVWQPSLGHDSLTDKIHGWAMEVINIGR